MACSTEEWLVMCESETSALSESGRVEVASTVVITETWVCSGLKLLEERLEVRAIWSSSVSLNSWRRREISMPISA